MKKRLIAYLILLVAVGKNLAGDKNMDTSDEGILYNYIKNLHLDMNKLMEMFNMNENFGKIFSEKLYTDIMTCPKPLIEPKQYEPNYLGLSSSCAGATQNGVRKLNVPVAGVKPFYAYCQLDPDNNGSAWTVLMKRYNNECDFNRNYQEYQNGFGNTESEYWIGLNKIHAMTYFQRHELWIQLRGGSKSSEMNFRNTHFAIDDESSNYLLNVLGPQFGDKSDRDYFGDIVGNRFSSTSADYSQMNCVNKKQRSWWMLEYTENNSCDDCHFTGNFRDMYHKAFNSQYGAIEYVVMAIRPTVQ